MPRPDEILTVGVDLDAKAALQAMAKFERQMKSEMASVTKAVGHLGKINKKALQEAVSGSKEWLDELDDLAMAHDKEATQLDKIGRQLDALKVKQGKLGAEGKKAVGEQIKLLEKQAGTLANRVSAKLVSKAASNKMRANVAEGLQKGIDEAAPVFQSFFSKDLKGFVESGTKGLGKLMGFGLKKGAGLAFKGGAALKARGAAMSEAGAARGGMAGGAMGGMGKALGALGGLMGKMGPLLNTVAKLGPLLSTASSLMMAVVKLMIDAESGAKEFQKELLKSAGSAEILASNGWNSATAFDELEKTVNGVRNAAFSFDNIKWGITQEETQAVVNTLTQEGLTLRTVGAEAAKAGKSVEDFTGELVHSSVAYSRAFGIPMQEINQMQAELFTDMGQNLQQSRMAFAQMTMAASESGIASNKFFAIIRGASQDLSLYNNRLEDAVKTLGLLGKVMSPKNAQKFMQTAQQALKGMGRTDLLKTALLGGPASAKALQRDLDRKAKNIGSDIQKASGKAFSKEDLLTKPIDELLDGIGAEQRGAVREAVSDLRMDTKASKKGVFGRAMASSNASPAAAMDMLKNSLNITGSGKLADRMGDIGTQMLADAQGISLDTLRGMAKFEMAIDDEKEALKAGLAKNDPKTIEKLQKAGLKLDAKAIDAADSGQIYDTMDKSTQELAKVDAGIQDVGQAQAKLTSSMLDKLDQLIQFIMNQIYNVMLGIWETIMDFPGMGGEEKKRHLALMKQMKEGPKSDVLMKAASEAKPEDGGAGVRGAIMGNEGGKKLYDALMADTKGNKKASGAKLKLVEDMFQKAGGHAAIKATQDIGGGAGAKLEKYLGAKKLESDVAEMKRQGRSQADIDYFQKGQQEKLASAKGLSQGTVDRAMMKKDFKLDQTDLMKAGLSLNEILEVATKLGWHMNPEDLVAAFPILEKDAAAVTEAIDPKLQAQAAEASVTTAGATQAASDKLHETNSIVVKFSDSFLNNKYKKVMEDVLLDSLRTTLFEYFMYSKMDPDEVAKYVGTHGLSAKDFSKKIGEEAIKNAGDSKFTERMGIGVSPEEAPANAAGGLVTGVDGGLASVTAAAGEGLASVGRGERILPAGAGRGGSGVTIPINVQGIGANELAQVIHAKVIDGIAEYKRRERFT